MVIEPVAGEGGYIVPPPEFLAGLRELCTRSGILLIFDEVQTGFGRTGKLFATEHLGFRPDITACAKGIGGGFPLGAVIADRRIMELWPMGAHGGTFGGNPGACAAGLAVLKVLQGGALENAREMGARLMERLVALQRRFRAIGDVRGVGLMIAVELVDAQGAPDGHAVKQVIAERFYVTASITYGYRFLEKNGWPVIEYCIREFKYWIKRNFPEEYNSIFEEKKRNLIDTLDKD